MLNIQLLITKFDPLWFYYSLTFILIDQYVGCLNMKYLYIFILLILVSNICRAQIGAEYQFRLEKGVWVEKMDTLVTEEDYYTANNTVFKAGTLFTYRYQYLDQEGRPYLQKITLKPVPGREQAWKLLPLVEKDSLTHDRLLLVVEGDMKGAGPAVPGYNHTLMRWEYHAPAGQLHFLERGTLVENSKNLWLQPPRGRLFRILALNPFPFIQAPYTAGHSWEWQQRVEPHWEDRRWREWTGNVQLRYRYTITGEEELNTVFGPLPCLLVEAEALSRLGSSRLKAYYHPQFGFVKLLYTNIDGSQLHMELVKLEKE